MAYRLDLGTLRKPERLPDGRLRVDGVLTKTGVFLYRNSDGSVRREYRPDAEVFRASSLATFADVPLTDDHPPEMLNAQTARQYAVGHVSGEPRRDGDLVVGRLVVMDAATIAKLDAGKVALSCGYEVDLEETPGVTPDGQKYDCVQRNIRGNHVAIVDVGRAGPEARIRMDCAMMISELPTPPDKGADRMTLEEAIAALGAANEKVGAEKSRADAAEARVEELTKDKAKLEGDLAGERARADAAETARKDAADSFADRVAARVKLQAAAARVLGADVQLDDLSDRAIKVAVVKRVDGIELTDAHADAHVEGRYESALERADKATESLADAQKIIEAGRKDASGNADAEKVAAENMKKRSQNAWKLDKDQE